MARTLANVKKRRYRILNRAPAAFTVPATQVDYNTLIGTFTEMGYCEDKSIKVTIQKGEEIVADDGTKVLLGYNCTLEGALIQSDVADYTAVEAFEGTLQDYILVDEVTNQAIFFPNLAMYFEESVESGGVEKIPFKAEKEDVSSKGDFRTRFSIPTS